MKARTFRFFSRIIRVPTRNTEIEISKRGSHLLMRMASRLSPEVVLTHWAEASVWRANGSNDQERPRETEI